MATVKNKTRQAAKKPSLLTRIFSDKRKTALLVVPVFAIIGALVYQYSFAAASSVYWATSYCHGVKVDVGKREVCAGGNSQFVLVTVTRSQIGFFKVCWKVMAVNGPASFRVTTAADNFPSHSISSAGTWKTYCDSFGVREYQNWPISLQVTGGYMYVEKMSYTQL